MRVEWRRRRFFANHPSRAASPDVRERENSFYQQAGDIVSAVERIEFNSEYAQRADTAQGRREARGDAVAARHDAKRAFPRLMQELENEIADGSSREVVLTARKLVECVQQYLRGNTVSVHLHPADALAELHSAMYNQAAWDLPDDGEDENAGGEQYVDDTASSVERPEADAADHTDADALATADAGEGATGGRAVVDMVHCADVLLGDTGFVAKRAGDSLYRERLLAARYEPHIAPFNRYVDALREERGEWLPYVAPTYGGVNARLLSLFQDPGPKTRSKSGTGMLCVENPDDSAARYLRLLTEAGIDVGDTLSWNSYPWYIARPPTDRELDDALPVLVQILEMLPHLEVVMLQGGTARQAWKRLSLVHPTIADRVQAIETYHTSPRVIAHVSPTERARREQKLSDDFARAKSLLTQA